jgi:hypothetical protein
MESLLAAIAPFIERFGVALFVAVWFMFRNERNMVRLITRVNKLILVNVVIAKTLDLDEEQDRLIRAASDEDSGERRLPGG